MGILILLAVVSMYYDLYISSICFLLAIYVMMFTRVKKIEKKKPTNNLISNLLMLYCHLKSRGLSPQYVDNGFIKHVVDTKCISYTVYEDVVTKQPCKIVVDNRCSFSAGSIYRINGQGKWIGPNWDPKLNEVLKSYIDGIKE